MPFNSELPEWNAEGSRPQDDVIETGWEISDRPPAGWMNYLQNRTYLALQELQQKAGEVKTINGNTPDESGNISLNFDTSTLSTKQELSNHVADYTKHPGIATTANSGNAYSVTLSPAPTAYVNSMGVVLTVNADSAAAATLNVNSLGAKPILKANGNVVTNLKTNGVYTVRYNAAANSGDGAFILQGEGGEYGNVTAADVLQGKIFGTETGLQTGTLTIASLGAKNYANGTVTRSASTINFTNHDATSIALPFVTVNTLSFTPTSVFVMLNGGNGNNYLTQLHPRNFNTTNANASTGRINAMSLSGTPGGPSNTYNIRLDGTAAYVSSTGFRLPLEATVPAGLTFEYFAFG